MLENKNILIVSPFFFDYHIRMKTALTDMGANVDVIDEQPNHSAFARILMRKDVSFYHKTVDRYFDRVIPTLKKDYDYILFIKCEAPTVDVLKKFKRRYPYAKKILYLWDSVANLHILIRFFPLIRTMLSATHSLNMPTGAIQRNLTLKATKSRNTTFRLWVRSIRCARKCFQTWSVSAALWG